MHNFQKDLQLLLHRASEHHRKGELSQALNLFEEADGLQPNWPQLQNAIGTVLMDMCEYERAEKQFQKAAAPPEPYPPAAYNLARLCHAKGDSKRAEEYYRLCVKADPEMAMAWNNLGLILRERGKHSEAMRCFTKASAILPDAAEIWNNLALALEDAERFEEARGAYERAIKLDSEHISALYNLATLELRLEKRDSAARLLKRVLKIEPQNESAKFMLQGLGLLPPPEAAPVSHIKKVFDDCAEKFETTLVEKLEYRTPEALFNLVKPNLTKLSEKIDILDLGCGTGLGADYYRPYANLLAGMDASEKMLDVADKKGIYDRLFCQDILAPWNMKGLKFHLIYSSDVFVYFGKLDRVLSSIHTHLENGGITAFSVEHLEDNSLEWQLGKSGRYAHSEKYVTKELAKIGFRIIGRRSVILRKEGNQGVKGLLVAAEKC